MAMTSRTRALVVFLVSMLFTGLVYANTDTITRTSLKFLIQFTIKNFVDKEYGNAEAFLFSLWDWLWELVPDLPNWLRWRSKEPCLEWAVKYGGGIPHSNHIASREGDIEQLKKRFDSFKNVNNTVNVVYIYGVPGSGKSELARQFGNIFFCKPNGYSTVVTLNLERQDEFRDSLAGAIGLIEEKSESHGKDTDKLNLNDLIHRLKKLLKNRPGWLLILDNINDPSITQNDIYKEFPIPGTDEWGSGNLLIPTQVNLEPAGEYVKYQQNEGMSPKDAKKFLCGLVKKDSTCCDTYVAEDIVTKLEFLPLSILAASYKIDNTIKFTGSYSCRDYLSELSAALGPLPAHEYSHATTRYNQSMVTALNLTINNARKVYSNIFRDFIALIGFSVDGGTISAQLVQGYLELKGYKSEEYIEITNFPLVYFLEEKRSFQVHEVVSYVFRKELERSETYDLLQNILKTIFSYYTDKLEQHDMHYNEILEHFRVLMQNMPARCPDIHCLITPDTKRLDTVSAFIFETYNYSLTENKKLNCSKLETYLRQLSHSPDYINRVPVQLRFIGYRAMYWCLTRQDKVNGSILAATKTIEIINEVAPQRSELHTVPVAWFLLRGMDCVKFGKRLFKVSMFLLFPHYLNFSSNVSDIRRKLCLSLPGVSKILIPQHQEQIREYCNSDFKAPTIRSEKSSLIDCFKGHVTSIQFKSTYHISLGRSYRLERYYGQDLKVFNPYGACGLAEKNWTFFGIIPGKVLQFSINYDKRVGLGKIRMASIKYHAALYFIKYVVDTQLKVNWKDYESTCQSLKVRLQTIMEELQETSFYKAFFSFVDNYCDSIPNLDPTKLYEIFYKCLINTIENGHFDRHQIEEKDIDTVKEMQKKLSSLYKLFLHSYIYNYFVMFQVHMLHIWKMNWARCSCFRLQNIQALIDELFHITGLYQERTAEVTELLNEIIAATIYVSTNDNCELCSESILANRTAFDVITGLRISEQNYHAMSGQTRELHFIYIIFPYVILRKFGFR